MVNIWNSGLLSCPLGVQVFASKSVLIRTPFLTQGYNKVLAETCAEHAACKIHHMKHTFRIILCDEKIRMKKFCKLSICNHL